MMGLLEKRDGKGVDPVIFGMGADELHKGDLAAKVESCWQADSGSCSRE